MWSFVTRLLSWEVLFLKKDGKQNLKMQRMKVIVGHWNRLVQESSYLERTAVFGGVISEQRGHGGVKRLQVD